MQFIYVPPSKVRATVLGKSRDYFSNSLKIRRYRKEFFNFSPSREEPETEYHIVENSVYIVYETTFFLS